jgi:hypothetical protein
MKTQLLEDFDESGSAPSGQQPRVAGQPPVPAAGAGAPPHPAVWQRARHEQERAPAAAAPAPPPVMPDTARNASSPVGQSMGRAAATDTARTEPLRVQTQGFAPQPVVLADGGDPDWLAAHLARDAALNERSDWSGRWTQRLAAWGAAGVLLALLAGGGLWLYDQSQVDGALVVVANTNPAPGGGAMGSGAGIGIGRAAPASQAVAPVSSSVPVPAPSAAAAPPAIADVPATATTAAGAGAGAVGANTVEKVPQESPVQPTPEPDSRTVASVSLAEPDTAPPAPRRQRSHVRKHPKAETSAAIQDKEPSFRQRREETLMQCRAHGYDERQCLQRGCEMTRFGFACKG